MSPRILCASLLLAALAAGPAYAGPPRPYDLITTGGFGWTPLTLGLDDLGPARGSYGRRGSPDVERGRRPGRLLAFAAPALWAEARPDFGQRSRLERSFVVRLARVFLYPVPIADVCGVQVRLKIIIE